MVKFYSFDYQKRSQQIGNKTRVQAQPTTKRLSKSGIEQGDLVCMFGFCLVKSKETVYFGVD